MSLLKGGHAAVGDAVPQLDAAVLAAGDVAVGARVIADAADGVGVLVQRVAGHEALEGVDVVQPQRRVLRSHQQKVPRRVEGDGAQHLSLLEGSRHRRERRIHVLEYNGSKNYFLTKFYLIKNG